MMGTNDRVDLHTHSHYSDGLFSPVQLVGRAVQKGLGGIALTDHDTVAGLEEFLSTPAPAGFVRVPGVEVSTELDGHQIHVLGYFVPQGGGQLAVRLEQIADSRHKRFGMMAERLRELGVPLKDEDVQAVLAETPSPGRPHLARILVRMGLARDIDEAFELYLAEGRPAYVKKMRMDTLEAVRTLQTDGAAPVLAHPLLITGHRLQELVPQLVDAGLVGIETEYPYGQPQGEALAAVRRLADRLGLVKTGGSDYHGPDTLADLGAATVPMDVVQQLQARTTG